MRHDEPHLTKLQLLFKLSLQATIHNSIGDIVNHKCHFEPHKSNNCFEIRGGITDLSYIW